MTKENFTSINVVIDRSGSMGDLVSDTIGGFNKFLADQKTVPGTAALSLCTFSTDYTLLHDFKDLNEVSNLDEYTYRTGGGTALLDALGTLIDETGKKLAAMQEEERPCKVIFLVITDGQENSSRKYTKTKIKEMISHQEEVYNWSFIFMGANMDAVGEGSTIGIRAQNAINYSSTSVGTSKLYGTVSNSLRRARSMGAGMTSNQSFFTPEEVKDLVDNKDVPEVDAVNLDNK